MWSFVDFLKMRIWWWFCDIFLFLSYDICYGYSLKSSLMSTYSISFYGKLERIIPESSPKTPASHLIPRASINFQNWEVPDFLALKFGSHRLI